MDEGSYLTPVFASSAAEYSPFYGIEKSAVLQEARCFNDRELDARRCAQVTVSRLRPARFYAFFRVFVSMPVLVSLNVSCNQTKARARFYRALTFCCDVACLREFCVCVCSLLVF